MLSDSRNTSVSPWLSRSLRFCAVCVVPWVFVSNAFAQTTPTVITQPQSQTTLGGSNVTFWVTVADGSAPPPLPSVSSGNLQLWLKADAGVVTNSSGQVSQWRDQSGHTNHAFQTNTSNQHCRSFQAPLEAERPFDLMGFWRPSTGTISLVRGMLACPMA
jgi:hypothetical protein